MIPESWSVTVTRVVDGDTVRAVRGRDVGVVDGLRWFVQDDQPVPLRLLWVDTPERGEEGWGEARADLEFWIADEQHHLTAVCYGRDRYGRILADLQTPDGQSASQWLMTERGWPPYVENR